MGKLIALGLFAAIVAAIGFFTMEKIPAAILSASLAIGLLPLAVLEFVSYLQSREPNAKFQERLDRRANYWTEPGEVDTGDYL